MVSPEQIETDRINVNENFMVRHHAIVVSRLMMNTLTLSQPQVSQ